MQDLEGKTPDRVHLPGSLEIIPHNLPKDLETAQMSKYYPPQPMKENTSDVKPTEAMKLFNLRGLAHAWHNDQCTYPDPAYLKASAQVLDILGEED